MPLLPEGTYIARAADFEIRVAKNSPTEWVDVHFDVKVNADDEPEEIERCTWMGFLTKKAEERTIQALRLCGWYGEDITNLLEDGLALNEVEVVIQHEEYNDRTRAKIAFVNKIGSGPKPLDEDRMKSIRDRVRAKAKSIPALTLDPKDDLPF
jgi:hypothetical protein